MRKRPSRKPYSKEEIPKIEPWIGKFIEDRNMVVMRDKYTKKALGVSYTKEGFKMLCNKHGKLFLYNNAYLSHNMNENGIWEPFIKGDTTLNKHIIVEKFVPTDHNSLFLMRHEIKWTKKAFNMLYGLPEEEFAKYRHAFVDKDALNN